MSVHGDTMNVILEAQSVPETGAFEIRRSVTIRISAEEARRSVNEWLLDEVSYMIGAEEPTLVVGHRTLWRVPAVLTAPHVGHAGMVGVVDVDVQTGDMIDTAASKAAILTYAKEAAAKLPPYTPRSLHDVPAAYIAEHVEPTRTGSRRTPPDVITATRQRQSR